MAVRTLRAIGAARTRRGNDGLTSRERRAYAARWRASTGRKPFPAEMTYLRELARAARAEEGEEPALR